MRCMYYLMIITTHIIYASIFSPYTPLKLMILSLFSSSSSSTWWIITDDDRDSIIMQSARPFNNKNLMYKIFQNDYKTRGKCFITQYIWMKSTAS